MIEVALPDGRIIEFPVGTDPAKIKEVARRASASQGAMPAQGAAPGPAKAPTPPPVEPALPPSPEKPTLLQRFTNAATGIVNDISAGLQGVNPVALQEQQGRAVGVLREMPGGGQMVDVDGTLEPVENYPADRFVTRLEPENGRTYIYPRTADVEEGRLASAGRLAGYGVVSQVGKAVQQAPQPETMQQAAQALDITPSFAMQGAAPARIASAGEQLVTTTGRFQGDAARVGGEMADAATKIADRVGPGATAVEAGEALQRGAATFVTKTKDQSTKLWSEVDRAIPKKTPIATPETAAFLRQEVEALAANPNIAASLGNTRLQGWLTDIDTGLTWEAARKLRTSIGEAVGDIKGPLADVAGGRLKAIYGALSTDLENVAKQMGPEAAAAYSRANDYTRASSQRIEAALGSIIKADSPERAFEGFMARARQGTARSNITDMQRAFRSIPKDEQAVVGGTIIRMLGEAPAGAQSAEGGVFSAPTFLTNWNKLAPEARETIAGAGLDKGVLTDLNRLALVIEKAKAAGATRNFSNTAGAIQGSALTGGLITAPVSTITFAGLSHLSARALTNPRFLRGLNDFYANGTPGTLRSIAANNTPLAIEAATTLRLEGQSSPSPQPQASAPAPSWPMQ